MDTTVTALGVTRRAVLTHSPTLHAKQSRGFEQTLAKAARKLKNLQAVLGRGKTRRSKTAVQQEIDTILKPRWVNQVITVTLTGDEPSEFHLTWRTNAAARKRLEQRLFGKRILFTNRDDCRAASSPRRAPESAASLVSNRTCSARCNRRHGGWSHSGSLAMIWTSTSRTGWVRWF